MNLQTPTITLILASLAFVLGVYSAWQIASINKLKKTFFAGEKALSLESVIYALKQELESGKSRQETLEQALVQLKAETAFAVQRVGLIRFNPFNDGGGNFSFCMALLDRQNSGIIITSMYGREQNRIYTKSIDRGKCDTQLTEEEEQAVAKANSKL